MTKKIVALCALLSINSFVGANGYPAGQGYQVPQEGPRHHGHHDHHHRDKITDEADEDRLKVLKELDESATFYRNFSRAGMLIGGGFAVGEALFGGKDKNFNHIAGGIVTMMISGGANHLINSAEETRAKERKDILERRAKNNRHH